MCGTRAGGAAVNRAGRIPAARKTDQRFGHLVRQKPPPAPILKLLHQRQTRQRVERIVEIDQQFAPLHRADIGDSHDLQLWHREQVGQRTGRILDVQLARACLLEHARARANHVVIDDRATHVGVGKSRAQDVGVRDAILKRDYRGAWCPLRDLYSHVGGGPRFDGDEDDLRAGEAGRVGVEFDRSQNIEATREIGDSQAVRSDLLRQPGASKKGDIAPGRGKAAADMAPDEPRTGDDDPGRVRHPGTSA